MIIRVPMLAAVAVVILAFALPARAQQTLLGTCIGTVGVDTTGAGNVYCTPSTSPPPTPPTVSIAANPTSITAGQSSTLAWSSTNAATCSASGSWSGSEPTSGSLVVSPPATEAYTLTCTGSGGSASASASVVVSSNTGSNCGLVLGGTVTFCEPFDVLNPSIPSRTGALDPNVWGVSRATGNDNFGQGLYNGWAATTQLQTCTGNVAVAPPNDVTICNGQLREVNNDNPSGIFENGTVTVVAMYPKQPFDFAGRTGTVSFDVSNDSHGIHSAWPEFWVSDLPVPVPFTHFDPPGIFPQNAFAVRFASSVAAGGIGGCPNTDNLDKRRWTVDSAVAIRNYVMEDTLGFGDRTAMSVQQLDCVIASPDNSGITNHVELQISQNQIDVYATDAGVAASADTMKHIAVVTNANLSLSRGLIWIEDVHYNADKGDPPSESTHTFVWDNVAFDGPFTYRDFSYDALDANQPVDANTVNLGQFSQPGQTASWNVLGMPANPQAAVVRVLFNFFHDTPPATISVIVNGHAHPTPWPYPDSLGFGWRTLAVTIPITDLVPGTNVVQLGSPDQPIASANVNIVLGNVPGGVPVLPGNPRAYPG